MKKTSIDGTQSEPRRSQPIVSRFWAHLARIATYLIGGISLFVWMVFLFSGSLNLVVLSLDENGKLWLNTFLCLLFFVQHSAMIRPSYKQWLANFIAKDYHGVLYTIFSGLALLLLVVLWQKSAHTLVEPGGVLRGLLRTIFFLSILGFIWGSRALGSFDAFGVQPISRYLNGKNPPEPTPFTVRGPYRWVRHPLYSLCLLMIWSCPNLSLDRLLYNVLWTVWIIAGTCLEERDLIVAFGDEYHDYQKKVPMLIPTSLRPPLYRS